jgi:hypothetical protein
MSTSRMLALTHRVDRVWLVLMCLTILTTWVLSKDVVGAEVATVATMTVAGMKVRWVFLDFMELRDAPIVGRAIFELWSAAVPAMVVAFYLTS